MDPQSFLFQAMVYLAAAVILVPLAKKAGLGSVLGYLIAGVVIGPFVLSFVGKEGEDLMHFAEFGVVMMLFIIGLELEPALLWRLRKTIMGLGGLQVGLTALLITVAGSVLGLPWKQALALGLILALSSTAIVLQSLNEKGLMKTAAGQSAFSVLLFQDIAVIPMLALFPLLSTLPPVAVSGEAHGSGGFTEHLPALAKAGVVLGAVLLIVLAGRYLVRPLFRVVAATRLREMFTATALLLVIGIAVLMTQVGLSPALGTFLAGVVLANSEYKHELESDIEPFKGLLLGLFFIAVGASIDFNLIMAQPIVILSIVAGLMLLKALILFGLGKMFRLHTDQNLLFALALSQVGEFAFVLFSFSGQNGILPQAVINMMIAAVAISMAFTPLLLLLNERLLQPRIGTRVAEDSRPADSIEESHPVIVAGFGHFGSTTGRFLRAHGVGMTVLDNNSDRVELLRKMGFKVYYGDASRYDLLLSAGAETAKLIIIALDPAEKRLEIIETIKKHFPHLRMLVRAENRYEAYDQMNAGMLHVYRETVDTSLRLGVDVMRLLGFRSYTAQRAARNFLKLDEANLKKLASIKNQEEYIVSARDKIEEMERTLQADAAVSVQLEAGWDEESLIADAMAKANLT
jgi:CPA2 family monovalent cation:H+ antiporter-2